MDLITKNEEQEDNTSASSSSISGKKRKRQQKQEEEEDHNISIENDLTFSDTMVALRIMRAQFPNMKKVSVQPFIMQSQLYSSIKDRTQVDRDLEKLRRNRVVRIFKLNTGQDDHAIMFQDDYSNQIEFFAYLSDFIEVVCVLHAKAWLQPSRMITGISCTTEGTPLIVEMGKMIDHIVKRMESKKQDGFEVFEWFRAHVIPSKLETSIGHEELCSLLSSQGNVKDQHISILINAGILSRQLIDPSMYWFAIPSIGSVLKGISQGRKELLSFLNRRKYKEMMLADLEKKRLRLSPLDMRFHLRDLIGSSHLRTIQTASGLVVHVVKD